MPPDVLVCPLSGTGWDFSVRLPNLPVAGSPQRARQVRSIAARRLGDPKEFGATCAFLCSAFVGFMSGQNLHLDGGSYPALI